MDGNQAVLLVENLSADGAALICPEGSEALHAGKLLARCVMVLPNIGSIELDAVVRWRIWPKLGVQFDRTPGDARGKISRFVQESRLRREENES